MQTGAFALDRFLRRIDISGGPDACWPWQGPTVNGYGYTRDPFDGRRSLAHRIALRLDHAGPVGAYACHHCDNRPCCNPKHLYWGDAQTNADDMVRRGRARGGAKVGQMPRGEDAANAKLTTETVIAIYARIVAGESRSAIAREFGMCPSSVGNIANGITWSHVTGVPWRPMKLRPTTPTEQKDAAE